MLKIENTEVLGWEHAIRGMRNPLNSWAKSDSGSCVSTQAVEEGWFEVGPNDLDLMKRLRNAGTDHRKFMRMITVYVDMIGPLYWWKEFDTYKVGTVANSCSTMHKITSKEFTLDDFSCEHLFDSVNGEDTDCWIRSGDISGVLEPINVLDVTIQYVTREVIDESLRIFEEAERQKATLKQERADRRAEKWEHIKTHAGDTAVKAKAGVEKIIRRDNKKKELDKEDSYE